jgi:hypothetical protein
VKQTLGTGKNAGKHPYFHQLESRKVLVFFNLAKTEGQQVYSQIQNWTISDGTLHLISLMAQWLVSQRW